MLSNREIAGRAAAQCARFASEVNLGLRKPEDASFIPTILSAIDEVTGDIRRKYNIACRAINSIYDANERYEALALQFYGETGMMAPGKDVAPGSYQKSFEVRAKAWDEWMENRFPQPTESGETTQEDKKD